MIFSAATTLRTSWAVLFFGLAALCVQAGCSAPFPQVVQAGWQHEQQSIPVRDMATLAPAPLPNVPAPVTVSDKDVKREPWELSLNDAVRITLENAKAIRVFTGLGASNSGRSIYDAAIATTAIDQAQAKFDPAFTASQSHLRTENPGLEPLTGGFAVGATGVDVDRTSVGINKVNALGGRSGVSLVNDRTAYNRQFSGLNPEERKAIELNFTQPLLLGGGFQFNQSAIVLARIDTDRSFFQFKDATQELVRGTIEAYWNLVLTRLELWAREIQFKQANEAYDLADARKQAGINNGGEVAQSKLTLEQLRAGVISAKANVLGSEGALRNILGIPATDSRQVVPVSAPASLRYNPEWEKILRLAEQRRPDIIELKLILEADRQQKIQAENVTLPQLDATALYRWNGLSGRLPGTGARMNSDHSQFNDWTVGVNFSVPLGLRQGRAQVRQQDLIILRDRANLEQGLHATSHQLAITLRELASNYEQFLAFRETRKAAEINLLLQFEVWRAERGIFLNVLQALNAWGDAINSEARTLINYNVLLTNLERQTGTILETHGLVFIEERFQAAGPLCLAGHDQEYPRQLTAKGEPSVFPSTGKPGENAFDLKIPVDLNKKGGGPTMMKPLGPLKNENKEPPPPAPAVAEPLFAEDKVK
ncbi:MAG: TolC family protein [Gemmataceae bacterium]|nr:TolC family protein [Gemmataceae bacterium]